MAKKNEKTEEILKNEMETQKAAPKKRGRKPKAAAEAVKTEETVVENKEEKIEEKAAEAAPKKRGRKPKAEKTEAVAAEPKKRGRKTKASKEETKAVEEIAEVVPVADAQAAEDVKEVKEVQAEESLPEAVAAEEKKEEKAAETAPKKRGRKPKTTATEEKKTVAKKPVKKEEKAVEEKSVVKKVRPAKVEKVDMNAVKVVLQHNNNDVDLQNLVRRAKEHYVAEGNTSRSVKSLEVYIVPNTNMVHYVVNAGARNEKRGEFSLF